MKQSHVYGLIVSGLMLPSFAAAGDVEMTPSKVALFKNGYGYLTLEGKTGADASMNLVNLPVPSFGTFWLDVEAPAQLKRLVSRKATRKVPIEQYTMEELVRANTGAAVWVVWAGGSEDGVIVASAPKQGKENPRLIGNVNDASVPGMMNEGMLVYPPGRPGSSASNVILLKTQDGRTVSVPLEKVQQIEFLSPPTLPTRDEDVPTVSLELAAPQSGRTIRANCIAGGVSWVPEYRVDLGDAGKAVLTARATVINELMDFNGVDLDLITGFPNLKYAGVPSPIAMRQNLNAFFQSLYNVENGYMGDRVPMAAMQLGNGLMTGGLRSGTGATSSDSIDRLLASGTPASVTQAEDLFFYPVKNFTCKYNETVTTTLFSGEVSYSHVYTWDIPDQNVARSYNRSNAGDDGEQDVWHCIRLKNGFKLPLTTGIVEFTSNGYISGQGMIQFTAPGQDATVKINKSLEMLVKQSENVLETTPLPKSNDKKLLVEGTLQMKNLSDKPMEMEITKQIIGEPKEASDGGEFRQRPDRFLGGQNTAGTFVWKIQVPPGATKSVTYRYTFID
ncbi:DUF4139 domain-containing protein [Akkermansia glycaniphila]|uniref:DUF4139 domain-containing protein n=1 Tax=Akkermansia glycaniphila TaxID=1679444 RepID=A0A1H6KD85_9BACT|nr:DUF4139 domain-containing protein [Akkermansia glycaniphila]SEH69756.1 domain of unknown function (duf4139) [Akkermansia glycaniphila]